MPPRTTATAVRPTVITTCIAPVRASTNISYAVSSQPANSIVLSVNITSLNRPIVTISDIVATTEDSVVNNQSDPVFSDDSVDGQPIFTTSGRSATCVTDTLQEGSIPTVFRPIFPVFSPRRFRSSTPVSSVAGDPLPMPTEQRLPTFIAEKELSVISWKEKRLMK